MTAAAASNWGLITNIVNSIVGVSVLTMPFCFKQCGIVLGALLLVFCSWMTHQSCMFLVKSASVSKRRTYAGLAFHAYGKAGKMLVETSMIGLMLGTCIAFYVVIGDLGSNFFARLFGFQVGGTFRMFLLFAVSLCIVLPLSLQRNMLASIQSFSAMALLFYTVFMFVIVLSSLKHGLFSGQWLRRVSYVRWEGVFRCIPIFGMSFACQSQVLPTYDSLDEPSVKTMSSIFASSLNVVTTFYVMVGFFGYVSFTEATAGNVLMHFPSNLVTEMLRVGFMMSVAVGFPMMILPCRQALSTLLCEQQQKDGTFAAGGYMPPLRFKALTLSVVFGTMVGGILIPNVETILGLTGATMGSLICFICPALIYKKIHKNALSSQVVLWVGLGVLVVSTITTLSVSEEVPEDLAEEAPGGRLGEAEGLMKAEAARLSAQDPVVAVAEDGREKPKLPKEREELEQAQIKGPVDVPGPEDGKEAQEEAQLDRPGQGIAVPVGEAHRHEPPVPHDKVVVDEGQDREVPEENKPPSRHMGGKAPGVQGQMAPPLPDSEREKQEPEQGEVGKRPRQAQALEEAGDLPEDPQKVPEADGQPAVQPAKEDLGPGDRGLHPRPQAVLSEQQNGLAVGEGEKAEGVLPPGNAAGDTGQPAEDSDHGGKPLLPAEKPAPGAGLPPEPREQRDVERVGGDQAASQLEAEIKKIVAEAGRAEMLDHAVLLQVIKEQQVQQKRLLDQQEKLLAVIEEQHKEIHQQRQEDEEDKPRQVEVHPEPGAAVPRGQEAPEGKARETVENMPPLPLDPVLRAPGGHPAPSQDLNQRSLEHPEGPVGRDPAGPPDGGPDTEPRAAQAKLRDSQKDAAPGAAGTVKELPRRLEQVPVPDPAREARGPEERLAEEFPGQSQDVTGGGSQDRKKPEKEAAATGTGILKEANWLVAGPGAETGDPRVKPKQMSRDLGLAADLPGGAEGAAAQPQAVLRQPEAQVISDGEQGGQQGHRLDHGGHLEMRKEARGGDHVPVSHQQPRGGEDAAVQEPRQRPEPELGLKRAVPGDQRPDNAKPNRDLKLQAGSDLRRRRRDLGPHAEGELAPRDGVIIGLNPLPDVQVNDLRGALDAQLRQAAGGALQVVHSRQLRQVPGAPEES
ncbi:putative sodium-coupled neutral amino acid transporter 10 isoform X1 [Nomascus leucogenys]|uniref:putative sodium-coupled neutral amino acid transporter 10 isoform X1 n=4 Tax=Nomascus leucogenys TaxID=61853 RepID=UPI00122D8E03|nr:putative sodium-coupled neutral amino acid transporter 10 isoform X1 [Nomascus leucogenys]